MAVAEAVVRELMAQVVAERGLTGPVEVQAFCSGGGNFTSALFTASVGDLKMFAKVAIVSGKMRSALNAETLYKTEQIFYNELVNTYNDLLAKHEAARPFRFPKVYASLSDFGRESVVMEDLSAQSYRTPSRQDPIDWRFASAAVIKLAAFHALSFAYEKENPEDFAASVERFKYEPMFTHDDSLIIKDTWKKILGSAIQAVKEEHKLKITSYLTDMTGFIKFKSPISKTVLAHGDYRNSNLMFKEQDGSLDIMVIDYQTIHSGSPAADLLYFIFLGTDQEFRRSHYRALLELYHRELSVALEGFGLDIEKEYPKELFEKDVLQLLPFAVHVAIMMLPIVTVDETAAPQVEGDVDISQFFIAPNKLFAERLAGIVADCVDWGVI